MAAYTTADLIGAIKRSIQMPTFNNQLSETDILALADEEMQSLVIPFVSSQNQEYLVRFTTLAITPGVDLYKVPIRSVALGLRELKYSDGSSAYNLPLISLEDEHRVSLYATGLPRGFRFQGDSIKIIPTPTAAGSLHIHYTFKPSRFVRPNDTAIVSSQAGSVSTVNAVPVALTNGQSVDVLSSISGFDPLLVDAQITNISSSQITLNSEGALVGSYIAAAGYSPVFPLPDEVFPLLIAATECRVLKAIGDSNGFQVSKGFLEEKKRDIAVLLAPRAKGETAIIVGRNGLLKPSFRFGRSRFL